MTRKSKGSSRHTNKDEKDRRTDQAYWEEILAGEGLAPIQPLWREMPKMFAATSAFNADLRPNGATIFDTDKAALWRQRAHLVNDLCNSHRHKKLLLAWVDTGSPLLAAQRCKANYGHARNVISQFCKSANSKGEDDDGLDD